MNKEEALSILGLDASAGPEEIKRQYKKMAKQTHPDCGGSADEFKKVSAAYEYLKNPPKQPEINWGPFRNPFVEPFWGPFQPAARGHRRSVQVPRPIEGEVELSFQESVLGCTKQIKINRRVKCQDCSGDGIKTTTNQCGRCKGSGRIAQNIQGNQNQWMTYVQVCTACSGLGMEIEDCSSCQGWGGVQKLSSLDVKLQGGLVSGNVVKLAGGGHFYKQHGNDAHGVVLLNIKAESHPQMRISGRNVISSVDISLLEALQGTKKKVPTINGESELSIDPGTKNKDQIKLKGFGVERKGDHIFTVQVKYPSEPQPLIEFLQKQE